MTGRVEGRVGDRVVVLAGSETGPLPCARGRFEIDREDAGAPGERSRPVECGMERQQHGGVALGQVDAQGRAVQRGREARKARSRAHVEQPAARPVRHAGGQ